VAVVKAATILPIRTVNPAQRVVEPELDMNRLRRKQLPTVNILRELVRKLLPGGQWAVRSPMRSIAREIEERWPSSDV
jgi:hypothetical protein